MKATLLVTHGRRRSGRWAIGISCRIGQFQVDSARTSQGVVSPAACAFILVETFTPPARSLAPRFWLLTSKTACAVDVTDRRIRRVPELEVDETIAPSPEDESADDLRTKPDVEDHSEHRVKHPRLRRRNNPYWDVAFPT